jgi:hypothetical protein
VLAEILQAALLTVSSVVGINPLSDPVIQRALANMGRLLLDFFTSEWARLAPDIVGGLIPVVRGLPPGRSISEFFGPPVAGSGLAVPPLPLPLADVLAARIEFDLAVVDSEEGGVRLYDAILDYRAVRQVIADVADGRSSIPAAEVPIARQRFTAAYNAVNTAMDLAVSAHERRFAALDRVVVLLRGDAFRTVDSIGRGDAEYLLALYQCAVSEDALPDPHTFA